MRPSEITATGGLKLMAGANQPGITNLSNASAGRVCPFPAIGRGARSLHPPSYSARGGAGVPGDHERYFAVASARERTCNFS
jgi:hypothetical protein